MDLEYEEGSCDELLRLQTEFFEWITGLVFFLQMVGFFYHLNEQLAG